MGLSRRQFTREFKLAAVRRLEMGASIAEVARAFEIHPNVLQRWRREFRDGPGNVFPGPGKRRWEESRVAQLERKIGCFCTSNASPQRRNRHSRKLWRAWRSAIRLET